MNNISIFTAVFILLGWWAYKTITTKELITKNTKRPERIAFAGLFVVVTVLKLWLSKSFFGHSSDMSLFSAWAELGGKESISEFYGEAGRACFVDYPPLYLYVLTGVGKLCRLLNISIGSDAFTLMIKMIPILSDTLTALLVFNLAKKELNERYAEILSLLVLLNPAYILNSTFWGQIDGLYTLVIVWFIYSVFEKRYVVAPLTFTTGFLMKPQMIIFLPLFGFWVLHDVIWEYRQEKSFASLKNLFKGAVLSFIWAMLVAVPMTGLNFHKFIDIYVSAAEQYPYASLNAANIFGAFGKNWAFFHETFLGITYQNWGFIGIILTSVFIGIGTFFSQNRKGVLVLGGFTVLGIFMVAHTMHERYMFPLILILMLTFIYTKDKRMFFAFLVSSVLCFIQTGVILLDNEGIINLGNSSFVALSWVNLIFYGYMIAVWFKILIFDKIEFFKTKNKGLLCIQKEEKKVRYTKKDALIILILTVAYALSAFLNLGSASVPETGYMPQQNDESVIIDLGEEKEVSRLNLFIGWMDRRDSDSQVIRKLTVSFGIIPEGANVEYVFGDETDIFPESVFRWTGFNANQRGRFIKIKSDEGNFYINEIALFDKKQQQIIPVSVAGGNKTAEKLIDEQDKAVYEYTWYDGTYFDEVYHPRTAYEYLNGLWPYENTHPPLGKLFISLGMLIFGVNPFGWRFFGTLCGVLMVPLIFVFAKQLLKETKWATVAAFLFTFDFMHLSQTRLATIDSYIVFFVMLMYYYMYKYTKMNFYDTGVRKTLRPLFLSGLFFGIAVAVKWQGVYGGAGLCVMFFASLYKRYSEYCAAKEGRLVGVSEKVIRVFGRETAKTIIFAFLFFVVIPFVIYFASYLPVILSENADISYFWENQQSMWSYHSSLTEGHPYGSPWWSWPLDLRPLYAYNPNSDFVGGEIAQGISSFGNPLVWWLTIPAVAYLIYLLAKGRQNNETNTILTGFGAMFLPWAIISRQAFIYHFFPCVPFVAIAISYCLRELLERRPGLKKAVFGYLACVLILYIAFYPVLTGLKIPALYADLLTWLPTWVLG